MRAKVRIIEPSPSGLKKFGEFTVHSADVSNDPAFNYIAQKIYADPGPNFFAESYELKDAPQAIAFDEKKLEAAGRRWIRLRDAGPTRPEADSTEYISNSWRFTLSDVAAGVIAVASVLFLGLIPITIYAFFKSRAFRTARDKKPKIKGAADGVETAPSEVHLVPLNCPNCGAGVALSDRMKCSACSTAFPVPREYAEIGKLRKSASIRLRRAEAYLGWAKILTSNTFVGAVSVLMAIIAIALIYLFFSGGRGSYVFYRLFFATNLFGFGILAAVYWLFALLLMFPIRSPRVRSMLPRVESSEDGESATAACGGCGGTVAFENGAIAGVCGYCGIETYRARVAWKTRDLLNEANRMATFSLTEAAEAYSETVSNIVYTPLAIMLVLLLPAIICAGAGLFF